MSNERIDPHAKVIAAMGETMRDTDWATDILAKCERVEEALREIRRIATSRAGGER